MPDACPVIYQRGTLAGWSGGIAIQEENVCWWGQIEGEFQWGCGRYASTRQHAPVLANSNTITTLDIESNAVLEKE
jgi:hypothetical protein